VNIVKQAKLPNGRHGSTLRVSKKTVLKVQKEYFRNFLLLFMVFNIYLELPFDLGIDKVLPAYPYLFSMPFVFFMIRKSIKRCDMALTFKVGVLLVASVLYSFGLSYWQFKLVGVIQTSVSLITGIILFRFVTSVSHYTVERVMLQGWVILLVGGILEVGGLLIEISDSFREWAYQSGGYSVYRSSERDLSMVGWIRPKFFASEPSLLAIGFMVFVNGWFLLGPTRVLLFLLWEVLLYIFLYL